MKWITFKMFPWLLVCKMYKNILDHSSIYKTNIILTIKHFNCIKNKSSIIHFLPEPSPHRHSHIPSVSMQYAFQLSIPLQTSWILSLHHLYCERFPSVSINYVTQKSIHLYTPHYTHPHHLFRESFFLYTPHYLSLHHQFQISWFGV